MTISRWVGHADGGMLIGKGYGLLSNEHAQRAARKVTFGSSQGGTEVARSNGANLDDFSPEELVKMLQQKLEKHDQRIEHIMRRHTGNSTDWNG